MITTEETVTVTRTLKQYRYAYYLQWVLILLIDDDDNAQRLFRMGNGKRHRAVGHDHRTFAVTFPCWKWNSNLFLPEERWIGEEVDPHSIGISNHHLSSLPVYPGSYGPVLVDEIVESQAVI